MAYTLLSGRKRFDSETFLERLTRFGQRCQKLVSSLPKTQYNLEYGGQLIRSSASPGANYIEALEALGPKDFIHKLRICRKEINELIEEGRQLVKFLTSSIITLEKKNL